MLDCVKMNELYIHINSNGIYRVINRCKVKDDTSGIWYNAIMYKKDNDFNIYVRSEYNFKKSFKELDKDSLV